MRCRSERARGSTACNKSIFIPVSYADRERSERSHFPKETAPVALRAATYVQNRKILRPIGPSANFLGPIARFFAKVIRRDSEASP